MAARFTHLALPCRNLDATIAWYEAHTPMRAFHRRTDVNAEVAWLAEVVPDVDSSVGLVMVQTFEARASGEPQTTLSPFAHLGFDVDDPTEVDAAAVLGRASGCVHLEPANHPPPVGYLCALTDPDGNVVEFSYGQGF
jgi:lactoylglutathione lyase